MLNKLGQNALCSILGAKKIERNEHVKHLKTPVEEIIKETKSKGMALPDDIEVRVINHSEPIAYAIGMNTIVVSSAMTELKEDIFKAKIIAELSRINRFDPDYLLFMLGSNVISLILAAIVLFISKTEMLFGDRRSSFLSESDSKNASYLYYATFAFLALWLGICYLLIRKHVRNNTFDSDQYVAQNGYGEALCLYIDQVLPNKLPKRYMLLEFGHPSKDERIAALQKSGVDYYH